MAKMKRLQALMLLSIGIAISAYSLLAINSLRSSARAVLMMGSVMQPGSVVSDRNIATAFLLFLLAVGVALMIISIRKMIGLRKE